MRMHASPQMSFNIRPTSLWLCNHNYNIIIYQHQTNTTNTTKCNKCNKCTCICFTLF
jgi:intein-encoded DNA endonuclease-like protein